jgi:hypothetical protein
MDRASLSTSSGVSAALAIEGALNTGPIVDRFDRILD